MPAMLRSLLTKDQIANRVAEMGRQITSDFNGQSVVLIGVLKGACLFLSDLARQIKLDATFDFIAVSSYGAARQSAGEVQLIKDVTTPLQNQNVILMAHLLASQLNLHFLYK